MHVRSPEGEQQGYPLEHKGGICSRAAAPNLSGTGLMQDNFSTNQGFGSGLGMIHMHYIHCALYFYYYCISSTSGHQALDPGCWRPLFYVISSTVAV